MCGTEESIGLRAMLPRDTQRSVIVRSTPNVAPNKQSRGNKTNVAGLVDREEMAHRNSKRENHARNTVSLTHNVRLH